MAVKFRRVSIYLILWTVQTKQMKRQADDAGNGRRRRFAAEETGHSEA